MANLMMHSTCLCVAVLESFYTKNLEKVEKIMNIQEYSEKFQHFSSLLNVCFHVNGSAIKYLSTEKTSKNSRNSAYKWFIYLEMLSMTLNLPKSAFTSGTDSQKAGTFILEKSFEIYFVPIIFLSFIFS